MLNFDRCRLVARHGGDSAAHLIDVKRKFGIGGHPALDNQPVIGRTPDNSKNTD